MLGSVSTLCARCSTAASATWSRTASLGAPCPPHDLPPALGSGHQQAQRWLQAGCLEMLEHDLRAVTIADCRDAYSHWLRFNQIHGNFPADATPEMRVTPEAVREYVEIIRSRLAPYTVR